MITAAALVLMLMTAAPAAAPAAPAEDLDAARAKQAFQWAQKLYKQARYTEAIEKFEEAYRFKPHPSIFFNIGRCYEQIPDIPKALRNYREYLKALPEAKDKELVTDAIVNLERRLREQGVQQLLIYSDPPGAQVTVDGKKYGTSPTSAELRSGNHAVTLVKEGFETVERSFVMPAEKSMELSFGLKVATPAIKAEPVATDVPKKEEPKKLEPPPTPPPAVVVTQEPSSSSGGGRKWTWVAAGVAVAGVGAGIGMGVVAGSASNELRASEHDQATANALAGRATSLGLGATISYGVAGAAAATALVLFFLEPRGAPPASSTTVASSP